ncbi:4053_t:CDS:2, partial [Gigaspora margarita]
MTNRGRATKWFKTVEKAVLVNQESRQIKNRRQKKWVLYKGKENELLVRKVEKKTEKRLLTTNWRVTENIASNNKEVECDNYRKSLKYQWIQAKDVITCLPYSCMKENKKRYAISNGTLNVTIQKREPFIQEFERTIESIVIKELDVELIKKNKDSLLRMERKVAKMGSSWVLVDLDKEMALEEGSCSISNWLSSMRPEIVA